MGYDEDKDEDEEQRFAKCWRDPDDSCRDAVEGQTSRLHLPVRLLGGNIVTGAQPFFFPSKVLLLAQFLFQPFSNFSDFLSMFS